MTERVEIGGAVLYCGDCAEILPTLEIGDAVVIADPPYGVGKDYGPQVDDTVALFRSSVLTVSELRRPAVIFVPVSRISDMPTRPQWWGAWNKSYSTLGLLAYPIYPHWEALAFYEIKGNFKGNINHRSDVFSHPPIRPESNGHPTPKPVPLISELLWFLSISGNGTVIDPYMGSGTTGVAALQLGRRFVGIEIERRCFDIACRRITAAAAQGLLDLPAPPLAARRLAEQPDLLGRR